MKMLMYKNAKILVLFFAAAFLLSGCSMAPIKPASAALGDYEYTRQYMSWRIKQEMAKNNITGLSIALVDDQRIVWAAGFGYADKGNKVPAAPETVYAVASISKLFTATAAMQLAEQGKMDIDKPLQAYLSEFSIKTRFPDAGPITPRTIMTHHSGLPANLEKGGWSRNPGPLTSVARQIRDEYAAFPPNFVFSYSNLGMTLLGHAVQNASGRDFASYADDSLFRPMNMTLSGFTERPEMRPFLAKGYGDGKETGVGPDCDRDVPAGALRSNVLDLGRFVQMVFARGVSGGARILRPETLEEMLRPQNADVPLDLDFRTGLAWMLDTSDAISIAGAGKVAGHSGGIAGFRSQLMILPEQKLGVVVLSNSMFDDTIAKLAVETLKRAFEAKTGVPQSKPQKPVTAGRSMQQELWDYEGWYATIAGPAKVRVRSGGLMVEALNRTMNLVPLADGGLGLRYKFLGFIPVSLGDLEQVSISKAVVAGRTILKAHSIGRKEFLVGEKITPVPVSGAWLRRLGEYEIINAGEDVFVPDQIRLRHVDGILFVDYFISAWNSGETFALMPLSDDEAVIYGLGRGKGETIRVVAADGGENVIYSGYLLKKR